ncbi:MAG: enolase C-terminal domain-like protein [archaeon]
MLVRDIDARIIKDSRKEDTIEVEVITKDGRFTASAPSGKSKGIHEAEAFSSRGNDFSIAFAKAMGKKLGEKELLVFDDLKILEDYARKLDNSDNWSIIGANTLYALEAALLKAIAASQGQELWRFLCNKPGILPLPLGNCIGGGKHVKQDTKTDIQEFLILPKTKSFYDAYFINLQAYKIAKQILVERDKRYEGILTDEKAFASTLENEEVLQLLSEVREVIKNKFGITLQLGVDVASSSFFVNKYYYYNNPAKKLKKEDQIAHMINLIEKYNLSYIEDPLNEEDFEGFKKLKEHIDSSNIKCMVCADDLTATQFDRVERAVNENCMHAMIIKPNQNGSILQTKRIVDFAKSRGINCVMSHRSGETLDNTIAHLATGWQIPIIKTGILGKERFAKLHELLRIEREISKKQISKS